MSDWQGNPVPRDEPEDDEILVWEVDPHIGTSGYDSFVERSWPEMVTYVGDHLDSWLEGYTVDELREGAVLTFRLRSMTVRDWQDIQATTEVSDE